MFVCTAVPLAQATFVALKVGARNEGIQPAHPEASANLTLATRVAVSFLFEGAYTKVQ